MKLSIDGVKKVSKQKTKKAIVLVTIFSSNNLENNNHLGLQYLVS